MIAVDSSMKDYDVFRDGALFSSKRRCTVDTPSDMTESPNIVY